MMGGLSGFEVLEQLRASERTRLIPVVLLTSLDAEKEKIKGIERECDDFISKPFDKNELVARVRSLLKISYYRRSLNEKEKFEAVIQELRDGVVVCDPDWTVTRINHSAKNFLGLSAGKNFLDHVFGHYTVSISRERTTDLSEAHKKFDIKRESTEEFKALYLEVNLDVVKTACQDLSCIVLTLREVTRERNENFMACNFLALLSHKFNTPIAVIRETLDLVKPSLPEKDAKLITAAERKLREIHDLSQRIIYILEMQSKGMSDIFQEDFLTNAIHTVKTRMDVKHKIVGILEKNILVHKVALWKVIVLEELMENSYKFHGKEGLRIKLTFTEEGMSVSDNGPGIPAEEQERIFEPFFQVYKDFHGNIPGLGLGLTLVKKLVELNRGKIGVQSSPSQGATIRIDFSSDDESLIRTKTGQETCPSISGGGDGSEGS